MEKKTDKYYQDVWYKRYWQGFVAFMKTIPESKANAIYIAVGFFVILIAFMEYKVFESTYIATGDLILSLSVLGVTAAGGIISEVFLHRNKKANDDQLSTANNLFNMSLIASAVAGFGVWAQTRGADAVRLFGNEIPLPKFSEFVFVMITIVTVVDILMLRSYIRNDVDAKHARNVERVQSRRRSAELETDESLIEFEAEVERKVKKTLKIEQKRKQVRDSLTTMYGGNIPADVLKAAMLELDKIQKADALADDDGDGKANENDSTFNFKRNVMPAMAKDVESPQDENPPKRQR
jgi:hypothetical protein